MSAPKRIQLRRTKGWRKPEGAIVVARPTRWGNPYKVGGPRPPWQQRYGRGTIESIEEALYHFSFYARLVHFVPVDPKAKPYRGIYTPGLGIELLSAHARRLLVGHDLACWCPLDQPCHADVLLELANR